MEPRKSKKVKSILGFLQEDVPGAPVDAQEMDAVEQPVQGEPLPEDMAPPEDMGAALPPEPPMDPAEDDLMRKRRRRRAGMSSADAFERALDPTAVTGSY